MAYVARFKRTESSATPTGVTKRTPELETAILGGFADGRPIGKLCREHGISRTTLHNWKQDAP